MKKTILMLILGLASGAHAAGFDELAVRASDITLRTAPEVPAAYSAPAPAPAGTAGDEAGSNMDLGISKALDSMEAAAARGGKNELASLFALRGELARSGGNRELISRARHIQDDIGVSLLSGTNELSRTEPFKGDINVQTTGNFRFPDDLKTGDIMLSRGTNLMGSLAARMSETPGEYSHLAMVYRDPQTRQVFILASDSGVGTAVEPLEKFMSGRARLAVLRYQDESLAQKAAEIMRAKMEKNIPYDYFLDSDDDSSLYCTEVAAVGFRLAGGVTVPQRMSRLPGGGRTPIYSRMGIRKPYVFVPQDIEVDSRFRVVAEWTDYARMEEMNKIDALYGKLSEWMEKDNYTFTRNILNQTVGRIIMVFAKKKIHDTIGALPVSTGSNAMDYVFTMYQFMSLMQKKLDSGLAKSPGYHSLKDLNRMLEDIRIEEYTEYQQNRLFNEPVPSGNMHLYLKPARL